MGDDLRSLIRLYEWGVDEKRRKLGALLRLLADLEDQAVRLEEELKEEQNSAASSPEEAGYLYGNYAGVVIQRRERIAQSTAKAEEEIAVARDELNEAYRELKKYEVAQETRDKKEALEEAIKDQAELDEIGIKGFVRQKQSGR